eukprot:scaffold6986_cov190-Amphora_coffeaeformis.AAC.6
MSLSLSSNSLRKPSASTTTTATAAESTNATNNQKSSSSNNNPDSALDFIASSLAVKSLFSLPYAASEQAISVAVHNLEGTLLIDNDDVIDFTESSSSDNPLPASKPTSSSSSGVAPSPQHPHLAPADDKSKEKNHTKEERSLVPISSIDSESGGALAILKSVLPSCPQQRTAESRSTSEIETAMEQLNLINTRQPFVLPPEENKILDLPSPEEYVEKVPLHRPLEYLSWRCRDMNLLVGSDALVYRSPSGDAALTLRVDDVQELNHLLEQHQDAVRRGNFLPDHQLAALQQQGKPSYAEAARQLRIEQEKGRYNTNQHHHSNEDSERAGFAAPDLDQARLQTCIVPSLPMGGLLDPSLQRGTPPAKALSPVSTVVDAYLDNIMANVPQLALCLQEKGFVQSVKLLQTADIPTSFLRPSTIDTTRPFEMISPDSHAEQMFSPQIMEMNASALLRFLKTNCTRNNTTYLLRREAGETNIQLYDISSISAQKQHKWIWWLAMMSYRFANRLRDLANRTLETQLARACRNRQRSLLENTLDLLEVLSDMDGNLRESLVAAIREHLADTFLWEESVTECGDNAQEPSSPTSSAPPTAFSQRQPYQKASVDALEKAGAHLEKGIKRLWPVLQKNLDRQKSHKDGRKQKRKSSNKSIKVTTETEETSSSESEAEEKNDGSSNENEAVATQLYGMHQKLVNLYLRLGEIHLKNYFSSSAMQCLRSAGRRLADSLYLVDETMRVDRTDKRSHAWLRRSQLQYVWLWEHCGHFARSFGGDGLWRERGHAGADDVLSVLRDAEAAFQDNKRLLHLWRTNELYIFLSPDPLRVAANDEVTLSSLSGVVSAPAVVNKLPSLSTPEALQAAQKYLSEQHILRREERQVFVASCLAYQRAIFAYESLVDDPSVDATMDLMGLLQQRLGDACNEVGKILLSALRSLLGSNSQETDPGVARALLSSSFFWFELGLDSFQKCGDVRNLALLRCNLCQGHKLRANAIFAKGSSQASSHAEHCLQEGANHLLAAHEALGMRETEPACWDMVSGELAATYLVLGVRRRQALIGSGNVPLILEALRLSPGKERSIVEPMERAMEIYEEMGNPHQAAATHYQLALYYSKIWTCQRDETKTREKLGKAFAHYSAAHGFFSRSLMGNESTYCLLCLDLSNLYASVQGEGGISKALLCCFDTAPTFSPDTLQSHRGIDGRKWMEQMATLASEVEDRVFKLLRSLTKLEEEGGDVTPKYKLIYRAGLTAKMRASTDDTGGWSATEKKINAWHTVLTAIRESWHHTTKSSTE